MECLICRDLERAYDLGRTEHSDACCSAYYQFGKKIVAVKNADVERARYELEEHQLLCVSAGEGIAPSTGHKTPICLIWSAA